MIHLSRPLSRPLSRSTALLLGGALMVAACSWSVPANPGRNASLRDPSPIWVQTSSSPPDEAAEIYVARCGRCHVPFSPKRVPAARWPFFVAKYAPRAGLFGKERERVLAWLMDNAP